MTRNASRSISSQSPKNGGAQIDTRRQPVRCRRAEIDVRVVAQIIEVDQRGRRPHFALAGKLARCDPGHFHILAPAPVGKAGAGILALGIEHAFRRRDRITGSLFPGKPPNPPVIGLTSAIALQRFANGRRRSLAVGRTLTDAGPLVRLHGAVVEMRQCRLVLDSWHSTSAAGAPQGAPKATFITVRSRLGWIGERIRSIASRSVCMVWLALVRCAS